MHCRPLLQVGELVPTGIERWMVATFIQQKREQEVTDGATASCTSIHEQQHYMQTTAAQPKAPLQGEFHTLSCHIYSWVALAVIVAVF